MEEAVTIFDRSKIVFPADSAAFVCDQGPHGELTPIDVHALLPGLAETIFRAALDLLRFKPDNHTSSHCENVSGSKIWFRNENQTAGATAAADLGAVLAGKPAAFRIRR
jgi:hypothetical protein